MPNNDDGIANQDTELAPPDAVDVIEDTVEGVDEGDLQVPLGRQRIIIEKNDRSLAEFHRWYKEGRLIVDPEWQRNYVWTPKKAARLIESFLTEIPVPVVYLARSTDAKYEVIDGLQRLTSVFDFFDNKYALSGLEMLPAYNAKTFSALDHASQNKLRDTTLRTFELAPETPKDVMFIIFERLNTGGVALNEMEIRNCLFRGELNNLLKRMAIVPELRSCLNQKEIAKRMDDRLMVLRFLAFYERTYLKATRGLKRFLNEFFDTYRNPPTEKIKEYEQQFKKAIKAAHTIFGDQAFRLRRTDSRGASEWGGKPNASIFQVIAVSFTKYDLGQLTRAADPIFEEYLDLIAADSQWCDCVRNHTGDFYKIEYAFKTWNERLATLMKDWESNDSARVFSRALKQEMFQQNATCALCGQHIKLLNDAALDHDTHYWRGGKTVPSNARLAHRLCNLQRK